MNEDVDIESCPSAKTIDGSSLSRATDLIARGEEEFHGTCLTLRKECDNVSSNNGKNVVFFPLFEEVL